VGIIDFDNIDFCYIESTNNAIKWVRKVRNEGFNWCLLPFPCHSELFPNMKNEKDGHWRIVKKQLNIEIYEITDIWNCGIEKRKQAHLNNVLSWMDPLCTAEIMGFNKDTKTAQIIDKILNINRQDKEIISPNKIIYDRENWDNIDNDIFEFYLDFETLNSNFGSIIKNGEILYNNNHFIFMIGLGYKYNNTWKFKNFLMTYKSKKEEKILFDKFFLYIKYILKENNKKYAKFYHWSNAEVSEYTNYKLRNNSNINDKHFIFYDLSKVFINEPIVIKGALDFTLKSVAKALYNNNLIKSSWNSTSNCCNGLNAMILANNLYNKNIIDIINEPIMKEIIFYNEIDCKVLYEIHNLIKQL
jgi:hypothetical protein